ncbi:MAG: succinylglutamate desuccinylase/aspartoacylase family protein, partial [Gammaproteobacteria bacterium]|nr:succinylglutamate desuccinylase/aspartoacylase family protein [Gammaproteobacteria bacterium]
MNPATDRKRAFEILGQQVLAGERQTIEIPLAPLVNRDNLAMSVNILNGKKPGPVLMISAAIHGDEINGVEIIRRLLRHPSMSNLRGVLMAIPVVNVHGFLNQTRYLPDGRDLNRSFPGSEKGSLSARVANKFTELLLSRCDYAIDIHTGARHRTNLPQLRVDLGNEKSRELAHAFGTPVVLHSRLRDGSLREEAANRDIPFLLFEGGESLRFDEFSIRVGVRGIINIMRHLGMLRASSKKKTINEPLMTHRTVWIRA